MHTTLPTVAYNKRYQHQVLNEAYIFADIYINLHVLLNAANQSPGRWAYRTIKKSHKNAVKRAPKENPRI